MSRVLSVEIGYALTKVCEVDYQVKKPLIHASFVLPTPQGMLSDGMIQMDESFVKAMNQQIKEKGIRTKQVIFSISSSRIARREVVVPMVKENRVAELIRVNAKEYFPIDLTEFSLAHSVIGTTEGDNKQLKVLILAVPKRILEGYYELATACGLQIVSIDYSGNSLYQATRQECAAGTQVVIRIDEKDSQILVMRDSVVVLDRNIPYGLDEAIMTVQRTRAFGEKLSYLEAMEICHQKTCIQKSGQDKNAEKEETESDEFVEARREVTQALSPLIGGIIKVVDFYASRNTDKPVERIVLIGLGGSFAGLSALMHSELGKH